jgi:hypothetical protein
MKSSSKFVKTAILRSKDGVLFDEVNIRINKNK